MWRTLERSICDNHSIAPMVNVYIKPCTHSFCTFLLPPESTVTLHKWDTKLLFSSILDPRKYVLKIFSRVSKPKTIGFASTNRSSSTLIPLKRKNQLWLTFQHLQIYTQKSRLLIYIVKFPVLFSNFTNWITTWN